MCRKVFCLGVAAVVLGLAGGVRADITVPPNRSVTTAETHDTIQCNTDGTLTVTSSGSLTVDSESTVNGGTLLIDGGTALVNARFNLGKGNGGTVTITGGSLTFASILKMMDDPGGLSKLEVLGGTVTCQGELDFSNPTERDGEIVVGAGTLIVLTGYSQGNESQDPQVWKDQGWLYPAPGFVDVDIVIQGSGYTLTGVLAGAVAKDPDPGSGATDQCPDGLVLSWTPTDEIAEPNHDVYLDSNSNDVAQATRASHGDVQYYSENQDSSEY
ncbi:MAG: hypothetical protein ACYSUV_20510, partial [Planctomycetota bacterium]